MQDRLDALNRTREADERRYKKHDVPWDGELLTEVRHASLRAADIYMRIALDEATEALGSGPGQRKKRDNALAVLTGTTQALSATGARA